MSCLFSQAVFLPLFSLLEEGFCSFGVILHKDLIWRGRLHVTNDTSNRHGNFVKDISDSRRETGKKGALAHEVSKAVEQGQQQIEVVVNKIPDANKVLREGNIQLCHSVGQEL